MKLEKYPCDSCDKLAIKLYRVNDEGFCENCFSSAIARAEYAAEAFSEEEAERNHYERMEGINEGHELAGGNDL